jgi:hypothetical protein
MKEAMAARPGADGGAARAGEIARVLDQLVRDSGKHLLTGPAHEADLAGLEQALGTPLPASFRALLSRIGSGILYDRHELFGPHQLQLHDIEFVPSLLGLQKQLGGALPPGLLPFHRGEGVVHVLDVRAGAAEPVAVRALEGTASYPDLAAFLAAVILPAQRDKA